MDTGVKQDNRDDGVRAQSIDLGTVSDAAGLTVTLATAALLQTPLLPVTV